MSRPRGEIREAMTQALLQIASGGSAAPVRQLAERAQVGYDAARRTLDNMARSGEVRVAGYDKPAGSKRWNAMYEIPPHDDLPQPWGGIEALVEVMHTFPAGVTPD